jgi:hypothetical protein
MVYRLGTQTKAICHERDRDAGIDCPCTQHYDGVSLISDSPKEVSLRYIDDRGEAQGLRAQENQSGDV